MGSSNNRPNEGNSTNQNNDIGITPDEIQDMIITKRNLEDQVRNLTTQNNNLKQQLNIFQQQAYNIQGQCQNLKSQATFNSIQACQQITLLQNQNNTLTQDKNNLNVQVNKLNVEIQQYKLYCNQLQLMLLNNMQNKQVNESINSWQQMNNSFNNNNNMNNNRPSFNFQNVKNAKTIIFNVNNKMRCPISTLPNHKLANIFTLALYQNGYTNFMNIRNFTFYYNANNISTYFYNNQEVKDLPLSSKNFPIIDVSGF